MLFEPSNLSEQKARIAVVGVGGGADAAGELVGAGQAAAGSGGRRCAVGDAIG